MNVDEKIKKLKNFEFYSNIFNIENNYQTQIKSI